ncbi:MAG: deoxyribose-phosphate aldolase [Clostridiales bacterium]|nr:deoxyribose-phosphate aldolase [Clostridiales bacterium]
MRTIHKKAVEMTLSESASYIDYSVLKPEFTEEQIIELTKDGVQLGCATIFINPGYIELCTPYVKGTRTSLCPVIDFPFGTSSTKSKIAQLEIATQYDAVKEIDIVANFGWIRSGKYKETTDELCACSDAVHKHGKYLKVILETDALTEKEIRKACHCCMTAKVDFIKTSTGFLTGYELQGAAPEIIQIIMDEVGDSCKIKGSGCIRTREHFLKLIDMGIDRMGVGYKAVSTVLGLNSKGESL